MKTALFLPIVALSMTVISGCFGTLPPDVEGENPGECSDDADNDRDGLFDCNDPDCQGDPACEEEADDDDSSGDDDDSAGDDDDSSEPADGEVSVLILYDDSGPWGHLGELYASQVLSLLGHFAEVVVTATPIAGYQPGQLDLHEVSLYIGSTWDAQPPKSFEEDFWDYEGRFTWIGNNFWHLDPDRWAKTFGFSSPWTLGDAGSPEFFQHVRYTPSHLDPPEEFVFSKQAAVWNDETGTYAFDPYLQEVQVEDPGQVEVLATIEHSANGQQLPYALRSGRLWFFADVPFTFLHDGDRYLVFTDLLHDLVGIEHEPTRYALFRLEDVHPVVPIEAVDTVAELLWDRDAAERPWSMALIPEFHDPMDVYQIEGVPDVLTMNQDHPVSNAWREVVQSAAERGGAFVQHGTTHQYGDGPNPINGLTGTDSEFWIEDEATPVPEDSPGWFVDRVERGRLQMMQQGWEPFAFEYPHYQSSLLDNLILPDLYATVYHRTELLPFRVQYAGETYDFVDFGGGIRDSLQFDWEQATVEGEGTPRLGVFFPYFVGQDSYGNRVVPENLGNVSPPELVDPEHPEEVRLIPEILALAALNRSQRCAYASFFYHSFLVETEFPDAGGVEGITALVDGVEALGFEFVSASDLQVKKALNLPP